MLSAGCLDGCEWYDALCGACSSCGCCIRTRSKKLSSTGNENTDIIVIVQY